MSVTRADDVAFVRFRAPDLAVMRAFLTGPAGAVDNRQAT